MKKCYVLSFASTLFHNAGGLAQQRWRSRTTLLHSSIEKFIIWKEFGWIVLARGGLE